MAIADCDVETYSEAGYVWSDERQRWEGPPGAPGATKGLPLTGAEPYASHPSADTIWFAYDLKDGRGRRRWRPGLPAPLDLWAYITAGGLIEAWNAGFERWWWERVLTPKHGWPLPAEHQWRCAMAKARASSYPGALGKAAAVMGLDTQKDADGARLMKIFSMPRQPTQGDPRRRVLPLYTVEQAQESAAELLAAQFARVDHASARDRSLTSAATKALAVRLEEHQDTVRYGDYNETDIAVEAEASARIPDLEGDELRWWQAHERINRRGVHIDREGLENCIAIVEQAFAIYHAELFDLTGIDAATKVSQIQAWLRGQGVFLESLDDDAVTGALKRSDLPPAAKRVLEIRAAVGSASIKKLFSIRNRLSSDDRLRDLYVFYGARTGRCVAEGQPVLVRDAQGREDWARIEHVRPTDEVWDGGAWVGHDGVVQSGLREVVHHDGVTATPEHLVYISDTEAVPLAEAKRQGLRLWRGRTESMFGVEGNTTKNGPVGWSRRDTWGGRLVENIIQAKSRWRKRSARGCGCGGESSSEPQRTPEREDD